MRGMTKKKCEKTGFEKTQLMTALDTLATLANGMMPDIPHMLTIQFRSNVMPGDLVMFKTSAGERKINVDSIIFCELPQRCVIWFPEGGVLYSIEHVKSIMTFKRRVMKKKSLTRRQIMVAHRVS